MSWMWWLLAPLAVTLIVAVLTWLAGRPRRPPTSEQAVSSHRRFLDDLADASIPAHRVRSAVGPSPGGHTDVGPREPASAEPGLLGPGSPGPGPGSAGAAPAPERPDRLPG